MFCWNKSILYDFRGYHKAEFTGAGISPHMSVKASSWQEGDAFSKFESPGR